MWIEGHQSVLESKTEENNDDDDDGFTRKVRKMTKKRQWKEAMKLKEKRNRDGLKSLKRNFSILIIAISCRFCFYNYTEPQAK